MLNIICEAIIPKENQKEIQHKINAGLAVENIVNEMNINIIFS